MCLGASFKRIITFIIVYLMAMSFICDVVYSAKPNGDVVAELFANLNELEKAKIQSYVHYSGGAGWTSGYIGYDFIKSWVKNRTNCFDIFFMKFDRITQAIDSFVLR